MHLTLGQCANPKLYQGCNIISADGFTVRTPAQVMQPLARLENNMDGEHIEMIISGWSSTELREKALTELGNMREELYVLRQLASGLTKRAPDVCPQFADGEHIWSETKVGLICVACGKRG